MATRAQKIRLLMLLFCSLLLAACGPGKEKENIADSSEQADSTNADENTDDVSADIPPPFTDQLQPAAAPAGTTRPETLVGKWQTTALTIQLKQPFAEGREQLDRVHRGDFQTSIARQKIYTLLQPSGVFYIETYNLRNKLVARQAGHWHVQGGKLVLQQQHPRAHRFTFTYTQSGNQVSVSGTIDALGEGTYRDEYQATWTRR